MIVFFLFLIIFLNFLPCAFMCSQTCILSPGNAATFSGLARRSTPLPQLPARNGAIHHILSDFIGGGPLLHLRLLGPLAELLCYSSRLHYSLSLSCLSLSDRGDFIGTNSCTCLIASIFFLDANKNPWLDVSYL
ncbi:hypothetical protein VPH35_096378 [Triticum aestivum]